MAPSRRTRKASDDSDAPALTDGSALDNGPALNSPVLTSPALADDSSTTSTTPLPPFTLRQLNCFAAVAEHGSISAAAQALHLSQSATGTALDELEKHIGEQLTVRRRAHGVSLTPAGHRALEQARAVLAAAGELASRRDGTARGRVHLGCYATIAPRIVPDVIDGFRRAAPDIDIDVQVGPAHTLLQEMEGGVLDLAIVYERDLSLPARTLRLGSARAHVLVAADHPRAGDGSVALRDLATEPFIRLDLTPAWQNTLAIFHAAGVDPDVRYSTQDFELARSMVGRGLGYSILVQRAATPDTYAGDRVVALEIDPVPEPVAISAVWPLQHRLSASAARLVRWLEDEAPLSRQS